MHHRIGIHIVQGISIPLPGCYAAGLVDERPNQVTYLSHPDFEKQLRFKPEAVCQKCGKLVENYNKEIP